MKKHLLRRSVPVAAVVVVGTLALTLADGDDGAPAPDRPTTTSTVATVTLDWARPATVDLGDGWSVTDTEGDAPMVTVLRDGVPVGFVEYLDYPIDGLADGDRAALDAHVAGYYDDIGDDRRGAPIRGYRFEPEAAVHLDTADGDAVRYGFRGTLPDGTPSERSVHWAGVRGGRLVLVGASAYDEGGLFGLEGSEFTSADLDAVVERLDRLVRNSGLPEPAPAP
jgi:hypothetical protein